jgi:MFS family permease
MWIGLVFALLAGAAFEATGALAGPMLIAHGQTPEQNGYFFFLPVILCVVTGSLAGGWFADRLGHRLTAAGGIVWFVAPIAVLAGMLQTGAAEVSPAFGMSATAIQAALLVMYFGVGLFTAAQYALLMDLTRREVAATQFSTFMGATNGCEAWAAMVAGQIVSNFGYSAALLATCGVSLLAMPLLALARNSGAIRPTS